MSHWQPRTQIGKGQVSDALLRKARINKRPMRAKGTDPSPEYMRECIRDGFCPWCDTGTWKALPIHTWHAHGISAANIRDIALIYKHEATCVAETSLGMKRRMEAQLASGERSLPDSRRNAGTKHHFTKAGREYQDTVRTAVLEASRNPEQQRAAAEASARVNSQPHPCPVCGKVIPRATPITCSPACLTKRRQQEGAKRMASGVLHTPSARRKQSNAMKRQIASGERVNPNPAKPHPCIICGTTIPKRQRRTCSPLCQSEAYRRAQQKAQVGRNVKIPRSEYQIIKASDESSRVLAQKYKVCRKWIDLIKRTP